MLDSIYIGMSGLTSFSKGLSNISNNVANLNTVGFKSSELEFLDLFYRSQYGGANSQGLPYSQGSGVKAGASYSKFTQGDFRQTGNSLDAAIDGNGFFILQQDGKLSYTRSGQFTFDDSGYLISREGGARVLGFNNGALSEINIAGKRSSAPVATTNLTFTDSLSNSSTTYDVSNITIYDSLGAAHTMTLTLTNNTANEPGEWTFRLMEGATEVTTGAFRYQGSGVPNPGYDRHTFTYNPGNGAMTTFVTLDASGTNFFSSSASSMRLQSQNGSPAGYLTTTTLDSDGFITLGYSNGKSVKADQLGLAFFTNPDSLQAEGSNRFITTANSQRTLGAPGEGSLGRLRTNGVELSNVDLAQQFSELIVVQRGYQASSQVITAANEMIQQLGEIRGRR